jgi:hypothetical protein
MSGGYSDAKEQPSGVLCEPLITSQQVGEILGLHPLACSNASTATQRRSRRNWRAG